MDQETVVEYRYQAVCEVLGGSPIGEVAARYGTTRQSLDTWRERFKQEGMAGLADRSRRPHTSPTKLCADVEALICQMRREHPRWGARRISHELGFHGLERVPSRATVHRVLVRNGLVDPQAQQHKRTYKRWQRQAPMHLWQLDIVGGLPLADGRECKLLTGIDDHSRFVVIATVLATPSAREVAEAFTAAMRRSGVPSEVLSDNGGQFTGRYIKPLPVEVLFEEICRDNGIKQRLTKPRSPTTTGKIERFHKTLRTEFLDHVAPFESIAAAQEAVDAWVHAYNHQRPHQVLDMAVPASLFRPNGPTRLDVETKPCERQDTTPTSLVIDVIEPPGQPLPAGAAVEFDVRVPPSGEVQIRSGRQSVSVHKSLAGRTLSVWADLRSIHVSLDGEVLRTVRSRLVPEDLTHLAMRGARPAGPEPNRPALRRANGTAVIRPGDAVEIDRTVTKDGVVSIAGCSHLIGFAWAGRRVTLRLDCHLMHAVIDSALIGTWPCPFRTEELGRLNRGHPPAHPARRRRNRRTPTTKPQTHHSVSRHRRGSQRQESSSISRRQTVKNVLSPYTDNRIIAYKQRMGWSFAWASSLRSDFNRDFGVSFPDTFEGWHYNFTQRPYRRVFGCTAMLVVIIGLAWWQAVSDARRMPGMVDGLAHAGSAMPFDIGPVRFAGMWIAMMAAMMLPGIIPLIARRGHMHLLAGAATASGYLAVWLPPAAIAFAVLTLTALNQVSQPNPWLNRIGGVAVALAGAYQFSGYKRRLSEIHCGSGQPDAANAFGAGVAHGVRCVGSSWALMSVQLVVGLMNVSWMGAISAVCVGEKTVTQRRVFSSGVGVVLIALGVVIILSPRTLTTLSAVSGRHPAA